MAAQQQKKFRPLEPLTGRDIGLDTDTEIDPERVHLTTPTSHVLARMIKSLTSEGTGSPEKWRAFSQKVVPHFAHWTDVRFSTTHYNTRFNKELKLGVRIVASRVSEDGKSKRDFMVHKNGFYTPFMIAKMMKIGPDATNVMHMAVFDGYPVSTDPSQIDETWPASVKRPYFMDREFSEFARFCRSLVDGLIPVILDASIKEARSRVKDKQKAAAPKQAKDQPYWEPAAVDMAIQEFAEHGIDYELPEKILGRMRERISMRFKERSDTGSVSANHGGGFIRFEDMPDPTCRDGFKKLPNSADPACVTIFPMASYFKSSGDGDDAKDNGGGGGGGKGKAPKPLKGADVRAFKESIGCTWRDTFSVADSFARWKELGFEYDETSPMCSIIGLGYSSEGMVVVSRPMSHVAQRHLLRQNALVRLRLVPTFRVVDTLIECDLKIVEVQYVGDASAILGVPGFQKNVTISTAAVAMAVDDDIVRIVRELAGEGIAYVDGTNSANMPQIAAPPQHVQRQQRQIEAPPAATPAPAVVEAVASNNEKPEDASEEQEEEEEAPPKKEVKSKKRKAETRVSRGKRRVADEKEESKEEEEEEPVEDAPMEDGDPELVADA